MIRVVIVEDSAVVRESLTYILESDSGISVVGAARDGEEALGAIQRYHPDVVTMDIHMPKMDGLEATRRIMETAPVPIIIVSGSTDPREVSTTFDAMDAGALAVVRRPPGAGHPDHETTARELLQTVKLMSEVKVVRRWSQARRRAPLPPVMREAPQGAAVRIAAIGASTGGPPVLQTILSGLPKDFPVPLLIVQHMAAGFIGGLVEWLLMSSHLPIHVATQNEFMRAGHVYIAPDECQMKVVRGGRIGLANDTPENGLRPSVSYLLRSVSEVYGCDAVAGLLTGMGHDGAQELLLLKEKGAVTFAQDKASSVVHGMAGDAIRLGAVKFVLTPEKMAGALTQFASNRGMDGGYA